MANPSAPAAPADADLLEALHTLIVKYPPTNADRRHIHLRVDAGHVYVEGYVLSPIHRRYLYDAMQFVPGVQSVSVDHLWDDETIRLEIGRVLPMGVMATVRYGAVVLSGTAPAGTDVDALATRVAGLPGVTRVVVSLTD